MAGLTDLNDDVLREIFEWFGQGPNLTPGSLPF
jgi:hypothetical protein